MRVIVLPIVSEPDIQADARHLGSQFLGFAQHLQRRGEFFSSHGYDPEIGVRPRNIRIGCKHALKGTFRLIEFSVFQGGFTLVKELFRIGGNA